MSTPKQSDVYSSERVSAFSDAVIAVAITLLVLDLKLPEGLGEAGLAAALPGLASQLWCYALSFVVIGILWMGHHNQFSHIERVDGVLLWLNLLFLMALVLIPFVTSVLSDNHDFLPTAFYAGVLTLCALLSAVIWGYASRDRRLMGEATAPDLRRMGVLKPLLIAAIFALSIPVAYLAGETAGQLAWLLAAGADPLARRLAHA